MSPASPAVGFLAAAALTSLIFWHFPTIDLAASALFYTPGQGFLLAQNPYLIALREFNLGLPHLLMAVAALVFFLQAFGQERRIGLALPRPSCCLFLFAVMALGPGALVRVLKDMIGRARPRELLEFGGASSFSLPWQFSRACTDNCSFISGEGASGAALLALPLLMPARYRATGFAIITPFALLVSLNRVAFGAHFLSDVVIGWCLVLCLICLLWGLHQRHGSAFDARIRGMY